MRLKAHGTSDIGLVRANNEDAWYSSPQECLFLIADGLGGHQSGEVASKEAIELFIHAYRQKSSVCDSDELLLQEAVSDTNHALHELSCSHELLKGMGTTLIALHMQEKHASICHVGDSRLYRFHKNISRLEQVTTDHLISYPRNGNGGKERQKTSHKGYLTKALGTQPKVDPDILSLEVHSGDIFLMCTDGLSDMISHKEIEKTLSLPLTIEQKVRMLVSIAKENGGVDNITVLLIEIMDEAIPNN